jgi:hypothetical protein
VVRSTGSGDTRHEWLFAALLLIVTLLASIVWTSRDRLGERDHVYRAWCRTLIRVALGATMLSYGANKIVPLQMPTLTLTRLVEPFGDFSPMGVLWSSIGAAPAYEVFVGAVEVCGGVLLFLPQTALLGALISLVSVGAVFVLNMTYDIPVKLLSFHLVLMTIILLAPNLRPLARFLLKGETVAAVQESRLVPSVPRRWATALQVALGLYLIAIQLHGMSNAWRSYGGGAAESPFFGIWAVQEHQINGVSQPPLLSDSTRWRHLIFQSPTYVAIQTMNDKFTMIGTNIDVMRHTVTLSLPVSERTAAARSQKLSDAIASKTGDTTQLPGPRRASVITSTYRAPPNTLRYARPSSDVLLLDGVIEGDTVHFTLKLRPHNEFPLRRRRFHWIQEFPDNR